MDKEQLEMQDDFPPLTLKEAHGLMDMKCKECGEVQYIMEFDLPHFCKSCRAIDSMVSEE